MFSRSRSLAGDYFLALLQLDDFRSSVLSREPPYRLSRLTLVSPLMWTEVPLHFTWQRLQELVPAPRFHRGVAGLVQVFPHTVPSH